MRQFAVFSRGDGDRVLVSPVVRVAPLEISEVRGELVMTSAVARFADNLRRDFGESLVVTFCDAPAGDRRYGDAPWVTPELPRELRAAIRDAASEVFGLREADAQRSEAATDAASVAA